MSDRSGWRISFRWRLALALAAIGVTVVIAVPLLLRDPPGGAATPEEAVAAYVDALNRGDVEALRRLSPTPGASLDPGIQRRLAEYSGRDIRITGQEIQNGVVVPHHASARLTGRMIADNAREQNYRELLRMNRGDDDRWYVNLVELSPTKTGAPPLPTADVRPAG